MPEALEVGWGGWTRYTSSELDVEVYVRFAESDGRLVATELYMAGDALNTHALRSVPLGRLEAWANTEGGEGQTGLRHRLEAPGADLGRAIQEWNTWIRAREDDTPRTRPPSHWAEAMLLAQFEGFEELRAPARRSKAPEWRDDEPVDARLPIPTARPYSDDFYRSVATVYGALVGRVASPVRVIADANNTPMSTAHRWVKEARRRRFLSTGRPGKAG